MGYCHKEGAVRLGFFDFGRGFQALVRSCVKATDVHGGAHTFVIAPENNQFVVLQHSWTRDVRRRGSPGVISFISFLSHSYTPAEYTSVGVDGTVSVVQKVNGYA